MKTNQENYLIRFLLPVLVIGMATTRIASAGGYDRICVPNSSSTVQCVATGKVEKYLSAWGVQRIELPANTSGSSSLLVCGYGITHPISVQKGDGAEVFPLDNMPRGCAQPPVPPAKRKLYGPKGGTGGEFCNGRTNSDNCKDCCLAVGLAQAAAAATLGKLTRDMKLPPRLLAVEVVAEVAAYGVIYWHRQACNSNCEISYERNL